MNVRRATTKDLAQLIANCTAVARESESITLDPQRVEAGVTAALADPAKATYWVAERDGAVVGSLAVTREWSDWNNGWYWWIQSVYVAHEARRTGVYSALYEAVKAAASTDKRVLSLRLYVEQENPARSAYEAHGMGLQPYRIYDAPINR